MSGEKSDRGKLNLRSRGPGRRLVRRSGERTDVAGVSRDSGRGGQGVHGRVALGSGGACPMRARALEAGTLLTHS